MCSLVFCRVLFERLSLHDTCISSLPARSISSVRSFLTVLIPNECCLIFACGSFQNLVRKLSSACFASKSCCLFSLFLSVASISLMYPLVGLTYIGLSKLLCSIGRYSFIVPCTWPVSVAPLIIIVVAAKGEYARQRVEMVLECIRSVIKARGYTCKVA